MPRRKSTSALKYKAEADDEDNLFAEKPNKIRKRSSTSVKESEKSVSEKEESRYEEPVASTSRADSAGVESPKPEVKEGSDRDISGGAEITADKSMDDSGVSCQPRDESLSDIKWQEEPDFGDWEEVEETSNANAEKKGR